MIRSVKIKKEGDAAILRPPGKYDGTVTTVNGRTTVFSKEVEKGVSARITVNVPL
jgi:hypothetical protein